MRPFVYPARFERGNNPEPGYRVPGRPGGNYTGKRRARCALAGGGLSRGGDCRKGCQWRRDPESARSGAGRTADSRPGADDCEGGTLSRHARGRHD